MKKQAFFLFGSLLILNCLCAQVATTPGTISAIPPGYYNAASGLTCGPLKTALSNIISNNHVALTYTPGVWNAYNTTDTKRNDANTATVIWDMYSDNPTGAEAFYYTPGSDQCGTYSTQGDCYNREHSFPQAWFGSGTYPMYSDLHHVFPTDGFANGKHDNNPYSEVGTASWTSVNGSKLGNNTFPGFTGTVFEPINEYKGDFARATLYMVTRYQDNMVAWKTNGNADDILNGTTYPSLDDWYIRLLYKWHVQDPVSAKEIARNDAIYGFQGNRNPFIDHPEYVALIWQCTGLLPVTLIDFTAQKGDHQTQLRWTTTQETNFSRYEIERSTDGANFNKIATIGGQQRPNYVATDNNLPNSKTVFYRLKMIDLDGKFSYSKIVNVKLFNNNGALLYPNPANNQLGIQVQHALNKNSQITVTDATGKTVLTQNINTTQTQVYLNIRSLSAGRYFISIRNNDTVIQDSFVKYN